MAHGHGQPTHGRSRHGPREAGFPGVGEVPERAPPGALLMESAWEVCNQLGGIYQVLRSKAPTMVRRWRNRYVLVGPYVPSKAALEFEERRPIGWIARLIEACAERGLRVHHGRWLIPSRPKVLLLEHDHLPGHELDAVKYELWEKWGVEAPNGDWMIDGVYKFGECTRRLMREVSRLWSGVLTGEAGAGKRAERRIVLHAHEWMGGLAIPLISKEPHGDGQTGRIATVFTTHATQLGRTVAWGDDWFYDHLPFLDHAHEAGKFNVRTQHGIERACAHACHVFTTVSQITGEECAHLLGRRPDMVLPNGLNIENYNVGHEFQTLHAQFKEQINRFSMGHFFPSYDFDLDNTLYFFTSGRFEPRNKGFDLCIEAMARLNAELKSHRINKTVVFFIVTQRNTRSLHPDVLHMRGVLNELETVCRRITDEVGAGLFRRAAAKQRVNLDDMISEYWTLRFRRTQQAFRTDRLPMVVTHLLEDDAKDEVLNKIRQVWLFNRQDDPVKIVYHPQFISPVNPLWGMDYDQFVRGCHLGIFPSAYEPWGYTPLEAMAMGVPAITSDLAGFGRYIEETLPDLEGKGLSIIRRRGRTFNEAAAELARHLLEFCKLDRRGRINLRNEVEKRSWAFDWSELGKAYDWAHDLAMARAGSSGG
ncbi:MAG: glycosyltransferase [Phycisphaerales bacterium]|nr:glycosyltransferase [Phycisphaerales bacterium]